MWRESVGKQTESQERISTVQWNPRTMSGLQDEVS